jgi:Zn-dependent peptidase ImmA (M78 family)/transcriptional regulator with XRE-family HTH domain
MNENIAISIGRRIRQAREMLGLSLRALADEMQGALSHGALNKYETGAMAPGSQALIHLSRALKQPMDYFFREFEAAWTREPCFRRRVSKLGVRERNSLLERSLDYFERYREIEEITGEHIPFHNPLPSSPAKSETEVSARAKQLRKAWNLGDDPLPNLQELMELKGIKVYEIETSNEGFDGLYCTVNEQPVVVVASWLNRVIPRKRMTEVHELAHAVLHLPELEEAEEEKLVNRFASELLLPEEQFKSFWGAKRKAISLGELIQMKAFFGASIMAIVYRARQLSLISKEAANSFWLHVSKEGWRTNGEPGDDLVEAGKPNNRFHQLVLRGVSEQKISESRGAAMLKCSIESLRGELKQTFA